MSANTTLTERDEALIQSLCLRVRLFSLGQVSQHWWRPNKRAVDDARRRLSALIRSGYLTSAPALAAPLPELDRPVHVWSPGDEEPDVGHIAWRVQDRWTESARLTTVYLATVEATRLFGGNARGTLKQAYQATHDLGVSQMYLNLLTQSPQLAERWIGEDILAPHRRRQKLPDAIIADRPDAKPTVVLEFGGAYDKKRVRAFHNDCRKRGLPYEIW